VRIAGGEAVLISTFRYIRKGQIGVSEPEHPENFIIL